MASEFRSKMDDQLGFVFAYFYPFMKLHNAIIDTIYLDDKLKTSGGFQLNNEYRRKVQSSFVKRIFYHYEHAVKSVNEPKLFDMIVQNAVPLYLLNGFQRLIVLLQAHPTLNLRFEAGCGYDQLATKMVERGFYTGLLRGSLVSTFHFGASIMQAVFIVRSCLPQNKLPALFISSIISSILYHPLDTVRTILYADTRNSFTIKTLLRSIPFKSLYSGVVQKTLFRAPLTAALYFYSQSKQKLFYCCLGLAAVIYPLSTLAVRKQIASTHLSTYSEKRVSARVNLYRGVIPFTIAAMFFGFTAQPLYSKNKLADMYQQYKEEAKPYGCFN